MASEASPRERKDEARAARLLLRRCDLAALATILDGAPYASLALLATDLDASPILLLSDLSRASRNLKAEPRASLLVASPEGGRDPLDSPRLSLLGRLEPTSDPRMRRRFLARHPQSAMYADFGDFRFYRMTVERAHFIGGFGRIVWLDGADLIVTDAARALAADEEALVEHFNRDARADIDLCVKLLAGCNGTGWQMTDVDPDGIDVRRADESARLDFPSLAPSADTVRTAFANLVTAARQTGSM